MSVLPLIALALLAMGASGIPGAQDVPEFPPELLSPREVPGIEEADALIPGDPVLQDRLRVVFWPGDEARARRVVEVLERRPYLPGLPPEAPARAVIFLAPDAERWAALTGGRVPHWGAGVAIPSLDRAVLPVFAAPGGGLAERDRTVLHEWAHLGLHDYLEGLRVPRWFDEGYAQWASGRWNIQEAWRLRISLARGGAPPLDSLTLEWPRDRAGAELAYLLSATAVQYLVEESGARGMEVFLGRWRETGDFEAAFRRTFGYTTGGFETRWLEHVKRRYSWLVVLSQTAIFWLMVGVALILLFRIRRQRDLERMARLRAGEIPDDPAYWEPPPMPPVGGFRSDVERARKPGPPRVDRPPRPG
jgi:hypothetical protein